MLERLSVRGFGIIDAVELEFPDGFAALTGETGAGKSLLVESLKLLCGRRAQSDMVRTGDDRLRVEGVFSISANPQVVAVLEELGVSRDDAMVLRREVSEAGRSRCWINDVSVTAAALQRVAPYVVAVHGQHEQYGLADGGVQRRLVDDFADREDLVDAVRAEYERWQEAAAEFARLLAAQKSRRDRLDTIDFQIQEIDAADPHENEDEELRNRRLVLRHAARIAELSTSLIDSLSDGEKAVVDGLARAERDLAEIVECGLPLQEGAARIAEAQLQVEDVVREIQSLKESTESDPDELENLESRLHLLDQLMLKYGGTLADVLAHRDTLARERQELESVEERLDQARSLADAALADYDVAAEALDSVRMAAGVQFAAEVEKVLGRLAMEGTRLDFRWQPRVEASSALLRDGQPVAFDGDGVNECVLFLAANPGEELRPMARVASGGELSRVHLALRTVLRSRRQAAGLTLLFDEVDSGLGGSTAAALAELLADLAAVDQVLVVTHLPQVAARADGHYLVKKTVGEGRTVTQVEPLDDPSRETEVARMLAGDELTETARAHARALLGAE